MRQTLDETEKRIAAALVASPRASWREIAHCLELSERTVARRAGPLYYADGTLRATVVRNPIRFPHLIPMALRVRCRPDRIRTVAATLARRPDTLWVDLLGGGDEISVLLFLDGTEARNQLLLRDLPATTAVHSWTAHTVLRVFPASLSWSFGLLTDEELARLGTRPFPLAEPPAAPMPPGDLALVEALVDDARAEYATLGERMGATARTARRRLEALIADGSVRLATELDLALLGVPTKAVLWLSVEPGALQDYGEHLSRCPEVRLVAATTGPANLLVALTTTGIDALYRFVTDTLGPMTRIHAIETTPVLATAKRTGLIRHGL